MAILEANLDQRRSSGSPTPTVPSLNASPHHRVVVVGIGDPATQSIRATFTADPVPADWPNDQ
jgi:hypothetical protein